MTKKDFVLLADTLAGSKHYMDQAGYELVCRVFASRLAQTNPRFDRERFLKACDA
jgi:hypothetical protein